MDNHTITALILHFIEFKILFHAEYSNFITKKVFKGDEERYLHANMQLIALDDYFLKIISNLLEGSDIVVFYEDYIQKKLGELLVMNGMEVDNVHVFMRNIS